MTAKTLAVEIPNSMLDAEAKKRIRQLEATVTRRERKIEDLQSEIRQLQEELKRIKATVVLVQNFMSSLKDLHGLSADDWLSDWSAP